MNQRLMALLGVLVLWTVAPCLARGQAPAPGEALRGLELLTPDERARVQADLERWRQLPPEERQRILENLETFRKLPPEARQRIRENQQRWERLSPEERDRLRERLDHWRQLQPDERQALRQRLREFQQLAPEERQRIHDNLRRWREMTSEERQRIREEFRGRREGGAIRPRPGKGGGAPHSSSPPVPQSRSACLRLATRLVPGTPGTHRPAAMRQPGDLATMESQPRVARLPDHPMARLPGRRGGESPSRATPILVA